MATDAVKSQSITALDSTPIQPISAGQGAPGRRVVVDDFCATTVTGLQSTGSYYKLCRIPTGAIIKSVKVYSDKALDAIASAPTLGLDFNLAFSDSTDDGTPSFLQGLVPQTGTGATTTTFATYSSPNILFGTIVVSTTAVQSGGKGGGNTAALGPLELLLNGSRTNYPLSETGLPQAPLWQIFNYTDGRGNPADPGGYMDLVAYVSTAAATGVAANIYAQVEYVI